MAIDKKRFWKNFKGTLKNLGNATEKILSNLEKQDKLINEKIKKATGGIE